MTSIESLKPIASKAVDLSRYEGCRVEIDSAEVDKVPSKFATNENGEAEVLRVTSVPLGTLKDREGNEVPLRASELFNLTCDENGELGWPTGPKGKLAGFLKKVGASHPSELPGKKVVVRIHKKQGTDGTEREFLGFVIN